MGMRTGKMEKRGGGEGGGGSGGRICVGNGGRDNYGEEVVML